MTYNSEYWSRILDKAKRQRDKRDKEWARYKNQTKKLNKEKIDKKEEV